MPLFENCFTYLKISITSKNLNTNSKFHNLFCNKSNWATLAVNSQPSALSSQFSRVPWLAAQHLTGLTRLEYREKLILDHAERNRELRDGREGERSSVLSPLESGHSQCPQL